MPVESAILSDLRPLVLSIGYRMTGSVAAAEAIARETSARAQQELGDGTLVESPKAYMTAVAMRLAIDHLHVARVRRAAYAGPWLPEPLLSAGDDDELTMAFLMVLEELSPEERAVHLLRETYAYTFAEIADVVGTTPDDARRLAARARRHVIAERPRLEPGAAARASLGRRFLAAAQEGDMEGLVAMLAPGAGLIADGGVSAAPLHGRERVAEALRATFGAAGRVEGASFTVAEVNGQAGWIGREADGSVVVVMVLDILDDHVLAVRVQSNPDKLAHLAL